MLHYIKGMERGYVKQVKGLSEADQRAALLGVEPIYTDLAVAIEHLRDGDMLALGGPLHILTGSATGIMNLFTLCTLYVLAFRRVAHLLSPGLGVRRRDCEFRA